MNAQRGLPGRSRTAEMFGIVTPEDRARWEQSRQRSENAKGEKVSSLKEMLKSSLEAASDLGQQGIEAKLRAAHQIEAQRKNEERQMTTRTITETIDHQDRDDRQRLDGFEF